MFEIFDAQGLKFREYWYAFKILTVTIQFSWF